MDTEKMVSPLFQNLLANWVWYILSLIACGLSFFLGSIIFGWDYKQRISALEQQQSQPQIFSVAGDLITVNRKPVARFAQKFEMLDTVLPLANGQIITFFAPVVSVEYLNGDKEAIELPRGKFEEFVEVMEARIRENPKHFKEWAPLQVKPDALRKMLKETEADNP